MINRGIGMTAAAVRDSRRTDLAAGRNRIVAGELKGRCVARLFLGERQILEPERDSVAAAIAAVRAAIEERHRERLARRKNGVPTAAEFAEALELMAGDLPDGHRGMLRAHRCAPGRTLTSREIARAGGYADFEAANLQYGLLGRRIAELLNYRPDRRRSDNQPIWTKTLAAGQPHQASGLWTWTMHENSPRQWTRSDGKTAGASGGVTPLRVWQSVSRISRAPA